MPSRIFPSFTLAMSADRDSFSLPDYYRQTRVENYRPYYRESAPDSMTTIDLRGQEHIEYERSFTLSDILEDEEIEIIDMKSTRSDSQSTYRGSQTESERGEQEAKTEEQPRGLQYIWHLFLSLFQCHKRKAHLKSTVADPHANSNATP